MFRVIGQTGVDRPRLHDRARGREEPVEALGRRQLGDRPALRIARRQPKFDFQSARGNRAANPFFDGFDNPDAESAERADQPVLVRLGTRDDVEPGLLPPDSAAPCGVSSSTKTIYCGFEIGNAAKNEVTSTWL